MFDIRYIESQPAVQLTQLMKGRVGRRPAGQRDGMQIISFFRCASPAAAASRKRNCSRANLRE